MRRSKFALTLIFCTIKFFTFASFAFGDDPMISKKTIERTKSADGLILYKMNFDYKFENPSDVTAEGIGSVPSKGTISILTKAPSLMFYNRDNKEVAKVSAEVSESEHPVDMPSDEDFSKAAQNEVWRSKKLFSNVAMGVLNRRGLQYLPIQENGVYFLTSTFQFISGLPPHLRAKISFRLSHPYKQSDGGELYKIQLAVKEKRSKQDGWINAKSSEVLNLAQKYQNELTRELNIQ